MSKIGKIAVFLVHKLWLLLAVVLVLFAILMSLVRYSLPYLNEQKHHIEAYARAEYGVELRIKNIDAQWYSSGPKLVLESVELPQTASSPISLSVANISVEIDFWETLLNRKLVSRDFELDGLMLSVNTQQIEASNSDFPIVEALKSLFLEQLQVFSVSDSAVSLQTADTNESFNIEYLSWLNKGYRHQGVGRLRVAEIENNSASLIIDLSSEGEQVSGTIYGKAVELDISPWFNELAQLKSQLKEGRGNFEFWLGVEDTRITRVDAKINPSEFIWEQGGEEYASAINNAQFSMQPVEQNWLFSLDDLEVDLLGQSFTSGLHGQISKDRAISLTLVEPLSLAPIFRFSRVVLPSIATFDKHYQPEATVDTFQLSIQDNQLSAFGSLSGIGTQAFKKTPGISGLSARFYLHNQDLALELSGQNLTLQADNIFASNLPINFLNIPINIRVEDTDSWDIKSEGLTIALRDFSVNAGFSYTSSNNELLAYANTSEFATALIGDYLPGKLLGSSATDFLQHAFNQNGTVSGTKVLWQGKPSDFPFNNDQGVFLASVNIDDADFLFSKDWPKIEDMDVKLSFINNDLFMQSPSGRIEQIELSNVNARIPFISKGTDLIIEAQAKGLGADVRNLMRQSSLSDTLGKTLDENVIISKPVEADISLYVPLDAPSETAASGRVLLENNFIKVPNLKIELTEVSGRVYFTNDSVQFSELDAKLFGQNIIADYSSALQDGVYTLDLILEGDWDAKQASYLANQHLNESIDGRFVWNAVVNAQLKKDNFDYSATLISNLQGTDSILPPPFAKQSSQELPLRLDAKGNKQASNISASVGDNIKFDGILPHLEKQFSRAHLGLGDTEFVSLGLGFSISAALPEIEVLDWYNTIFRLLDVEPSEATPIFPTPARLFIEAERLKIANQVVNGADLIIKQNNDDWTIEANAQELNATIGIDKSWRTNGINIDADYVRIEKINEHLDKNEKAQSDFSHLSPESLPPLRFYCRQCEILSNQLGEVSIVTNPNDDGMSLDRVSFESNNGMFNAQGQWYKRNNDHYTFLSGKFDSGDFGAFLKDFNFDSGIKDSEANVEFTATWAHSPMDFEFANLDGQIQWQLTDGYLTELSDKGSRIFTLLSLESLVRKLSLDFRDVFAKGFFYDQMSGSVQITDGTADTRDTEIDGGAGDMSIYGYTDLVSRELNYNVSFTPKVTGNLPVLIYFMVNPPTAIAALALDQVLTSTKVISNVNYSITGTLDEPQLKETGRQSTEVELPASRDLQNKEESFIPPTIDDAIQVDIQESEDS